MRKKKILNIQLHTKKDNSSEENSNRKEDNPSIIDQNLFIPKKLKRNYEQDEMCVSEELLSDSLSNSPYTIESKNEENALIQPNEDFSRLITVELVLAPWKPK